MRKLIEAYKTAPTLKNAQKIRAYTRKHPMSMCLLSVEHANLVADAIHHSNVGK